LNATSLSPPTSGTGASATAPRGRYLALLSLGALGVVYGDIGTSPLYAIRECFSPRYGLQPDRINVLGILSLIFWSLTLLISVWYLGVVLKADNKGEGGILALTALFGPLSSLKLGQRRPIYMTLGIFGAALLYGDGMLTPAISVMGAIEGLKVATPVFEPYIVPIVVLILIFIFSFQRFGTAKVGYAFGPVTMIWFAAIGTLGVISVAREPGVLAAINPVYAIRFFLDHGWAGFPVLGSVFLVVTGGEAIYADMGHFGRRPIRLAWYSIAFPGLLLNYFGQGALLLRDPNSVANPFFHLAAGWMLYPMVVLATMAAVIASQAVISGSFSVTRQAVQLGLAPRFVVKHTSAREIGQIYVPGINWLLLIASIGIVIGFRTSGNIASAYGVALTFTMAITTLLAFRYMTRLRGVSHRRALLIVGGFLLMVLAFLGANAFKIPHGGWFALVIGILGYTLLTTWQRGRSLLAQRLGEQTMPLQILLGDIAAEPPLRVRGTAIFMTAQSDGVPYTLLHNLRHNQVLHERVIFLTVTTTEVPRVEPEERIAIEKIAEGFYRITASYGFVEEPDVMEIIEACRGKGLTIAVEATTFFVGRETLLASERPGMPQWRERLFSVMARNTPRITTSFNIPTGQVIEIGAQIEL
jgi:KUP system potassium uptake protein